LLSGAGASFGLNSGLYLLPSLIARKARNQSTNTEHMPMRLGWLALAVIFGGVFISVLGPGIHFSN
jgi:hypothetical protein